MPHLLVKFLNNHMLSADSPSIKLRLLNNTFYRLGFDSGLAAIFDDQYQVLSVGVHSKSNLTSFGVKFYNRSLGAKVEEGIFDGTNTFLFD